MEGRGGRKPKALVELDGHVRDAFFGRNVVAVAAAEGRNATSGRAFHAFKEGLVLGGEGGGGEGNGCFEGRLPGFFFVHAADPRLWSAWDQGTKRGAGCKCVCVLTNAKRNLFDQMKGNCRIPGMW